MWISRRAAAHITQSDAGPGGQIFARQIWRAHGQPAGPAKRFNIPAPSSYGRGKQGRRRIQSPRRDFPNQPYPVLASNCVPDDHVQAAPHTADFSGEAVAAAGPTVGKV